MELIRLQSLVLAFALGGLGFGMQTNVAKANAAQVSSDLRLMVAGGFAENEIVIDFPQRDIHLHASRPIRVEMVQPGNEPQGSGVISSRKEQGAPNGKP